MSPDPEDLLRAGRIEAVPPDRNLANFDRMRRSRNRSECGIRIFGDAEVQADLTHARSIVEAVQSTLRDEEKA